VPHGASVQLLKKLFDPVVFLTHHECIFLFVYFLYMHCAQLVIFGNFVMATATGRFITIIAIISNKSEGRLRVQICGDY
jgi:hypothetical protein